MTKHARDEEGKASQQVEALPADRSPWGVIGRGDLTGVAGGASQNRDASEFDERPIELILSYIVKTRERAKTLKGIFDDLKDLPDSEILRVGRVVKDLKTDFARRNVPQKAPELYADRRKGEGIIDFLRRVYRDGGYLTGEFKIADLWRLDRQAGIALRDYMKGGTTLPDDINLPRSRSLRDKAAAGSSRRLLR